LSNKAIEEANFQMKMQLDKKDLKKENLIQLMGLFGDQK